MVNQKRKLYLFFSILFISIFVLNCFTLESVQDDYVYKFAWTAGGENSSHIIQNLGDVLSSQYYHYQYQNGRLVPHLLLQLFDGVLGKGFFNVISSIVFCLLVYLICLLANYRQSLCIVLLTTFLVTLGNPIFKETVLWFAGSFNYLWSFVFVLVFLLIVRRIWSESIHNRIVYYSPLMIMLGWVNEGATIPVCLALGFLMLIDIRRVVKCAVLPYALFFFLGVALTVFAPSTFNRLDEFGGSSVSIVSRCQSVIAAFREVRVFWIFLLLAFFVFFKKREVFYRFEKKHRLIILCVFCSFFVFFISNRHYARVLFPIEMFSVIAIVALVSVYNVERQKWISAICSIFLIIFVIPLFYYSYLNYNNSKYALSQLKDPNRNIVLTKTDRTPRFYYNYVMKHVDYGEKDVWYWACEEVDHVAPYFGKEKLEYYPEELYLDMRDNPEHYDYFNTVEGTKLLVRKISPTDSITKVVIHLRSTEKKDIPFYVVPFITKLNKYSVRQVEPRFFKKTMVGNHAFLVITPPMLPEQRKRVETIEVL